MTIGNALAFIKRGMIDDALRRKLNRSIGTSGLFQILGDENLMFSFQEFDEAFHHRLVQCQEEHEAVQLKEFNLWWSLLSQTNPGEQTGRFGHGNSSGYSGKS